MDDTLRTLLILVPALPLAAAILTPILGPKLLKEQSHWIALIATGAAFICSLLLVYHVHHAHEQLGDHGSFARVYTLWTWADITDAYGSGDNARDLDLAVTLRLDGLTAMMLATVTFVATLVVLFSVGYMHHERGYWRYFTYVALFVFSMVMLVSVSNFLMLYVFWEAVGVCSYLLIGFWYHKPEASAAAKKAFLVNRVGDFGFALALFLIWTTYGTLEFHDSSEVVGQSAAAVSQAENAVPGVLGLSRIEQNQYVGGGIALAICLLLLVGACGKSAQFPLHVWLPDAMEGPTPASALIHAATMVTAGIYMITRCTPLFMVSPDAQLVVACIGAFTALLAALIALTQFDLKRVLAYSTISQLGYMFLALGSGMLAGITAGMFHLFTHAFFKALLFMGAGSVMHAMGNIVDMRRFGGLRRILPITHWTFLLGCLALGGVWPFAGFWSKDAILASIHDKAEVLHHGGVSHEGEHSGQAEMGVGPEVSSQATPVFGLSPEGLATWYEVLLYVAVFTAFLTAFYTFRAFFMTFYGEERVPPEAGHHAHESPPVMWVPLAVLGLCSLVVGFLFEVGFFGLFPGHTFAHLLGGTPSLALGRVAETAQPYEFHITIAAVSTIVALLGIGLASFLYLGEDREVKWFSRVMQSKWIGGYLSPYDLSQHRFYFDEIYSVIVVKPLELLAVISYWWDRWVIDGLVNFFGRVPAWFGALMRSLQMGLVQFYALAMVLGAIILLAAAWFR